MVTICKRVIDREYQNALKECVEALPLDRWVVIPSTMKLTSCKTKYGIACSDGTIQINSAFIGTHAINQLRNTIRHELAHLAVGISQQHNAVFRQCERLFGARCVVGAEELVAFEKNVSHKWLLMAHLMNGRSIVLGGAHRRHKKYLHYKPNIFRKLTIEGVPVNSFEYLINV